MHEECGVFGIFGHERAAADVLMGLRFLQHRGQEGCGVACVDEAGRIVMRKGKGLVSQVFTLDAYKDDPSRMAIGHVRYGTSGGRGPDNVQPFHFQGKTLDYAIAHNGNIINAGELKRWMERIGVLFHSTSDSEILGHLVKRWSDELDKMSVEAIRSALNQIEGAFSFLILTPDRLFVCRDKYGFRPLCLGRLGEGWVVSSETCAIEGIGAEYIRDVKPGEVLEISREGIQSSFYSIFHRHDMCAMEYIYFARPDSDIEGMNVHAFRKASGRILYRESPVEADLVFGVPDSGLSSAIGFSEESGIPLETGLVKNGYIGRTFIQPSQEMRNAGVKMKLSPVRSVVQGKRVVVIDDSIVRGTTSRQIARMLREAGASEVHMRITSPPLRHPCFYGVDISTEAELISARLDVEGVRKFIEVDSLAFMSEAGLLEAGRRAELCTACFSGRYPTALYAHGEE